MKEISDILLFTEKLKNELVDNFSALIIYGSEVTNQNDEFSDTDICVIIKNKDGEPIHKIREATSEMQDRNYFVFTVEEDELERNIKAGDVFFKYEVIGKGRIIHEREGYVSKIKKEMESTETDFQAAEQLHKERYKADKNGLLHELQNILDRLRWGYTDLICMRLAKRQLEPHGVEEYAFLMNNDEILSGFVDDFKEILKTNKDYQHQRINFPFSKLKYLYDRLLELEQNILIS